MCVCPSIRGWRGEPPYMGPGPAPHHTGAPTPPHRDPPGPGSHHTSTPWHDQTCWTWTSPYMHPHPPRTDWKGFLIAKVAAWPNFISYNLILLMCTYNFQGACFNSQTAHRQRYGQFKVGQVHFIIDTWMRDSQETDLSRVLICLNLILISIIWHLMK